MTTATQVVVFYVVFGVGVMSIPVWLLVCWRRDRRRRATVTRTGPFCVTTTEYDTVPTT